MAAPEPRDFSYVIECQLPFPELVLVPFWLLEVLELVEEPCPLLVVEEFKLELDDEELEELEELDEDDGGVAPAK